MHIYRYIQVEPSSLISETVELWEPRHRLDKRRRVGRIRRRPDLIWILRALSPKGSMYPNSIYFGLKVVPI